MIANLIPLIVVLAYVLLQCASYRLQQAAQPTRLRIARLGELILSKTEPGSTAHDHVKLTLELAFGARKFLMLSIVVMPFLWARFACDRDFRVRLRKRVYAPPPEVKAELLEFRGLRMELMFSNNPVLSLIYYVEVALLAGVFATVGAMIRGRFPQRAENALSPEIGRLSKQVHFPTFKIPAHA